MIEVEATDVINLLLKETNNINFNFSPEKLDIIAEIVINLTEGFSPLILKLRLDLRDSNYVSIEYNIIYTFIKKRKLFVTNDIII